MRIFGIRKFVIAPFVAVALLSSGVLAASAFAEVSGSQTYDNASAASDKWDLNSGHIDTIYDTADGVWYEPGQSTTQKEDNVSHAAGTYILKIPTLIKYENMNVGRVSTHDEYPVHLVGALPSGQKVTVTAETGKSVSNGSDSLFEETTRGLESWTVEDAFGDADTAEDGQQTYPDGSLAGTTTTDVIELSGIAKTSGAYTGYVQSDVPTGKPVGFHSQDLVVFHDYWRFADRSRVPSST